MYQSLWHSLCSYYHFHLYYYLVPLSLSLSHRAIRLAYTSSNLRYFHLGLLSICLISDIIKNTLLIEVDFNVLVCWSRYDNQSIILISLFW